MAFFIGTRSLELLTFLPQKAKAIFFHNSYQKEYTQLNQTILDRVMLEQYWRNVSNGIIKKQTFIPLNTICRELSKRQP